MIDQLLHFDPTLALDSATCSALASRGYGSLLVQSSNGKLPSRLPCSFCYPQFSPTFYARARTANLPLPSELSQLLRWTPCQDPAYWYFIVSAVVNEDGCRRVGYTYLNVLCFRAGAVVPVLQSELNEAPLCYSTNHESLFAHLYAILCNCDFDRANLEANF